MAPDQCRHCIVKCRTMISRIFANPPRQQYHPFESNFAMIAPHMFGGYAHWGGMAQIMFGPWGGGWRGSAMVWAGRADDGAETASGGADWLLIDAATAFCTIISQPKSQRCTIISQPKSQRERKATHSKPPERVLLATKSSLGTIHAQAHILPPCCIHHNPILHSLLLPTCCIHHNPI